MVRYLIYFGRSVKKAMKNHADLTIRAINELRIISKDELKYNSELWKQCADMTLREDYPSLYHTPASGMTTRVSVKT